MTIDQHTTLDSSTLRIVEVPLRALTEEAFAGYGRIVTSFAEAEVDIVPWPYRGRRFLDKGTGTGGGITSGPFHMKWKGDVLYAENHAVGGFYITGWTRRPEEAREDQATVPRQSVLTCEANYHPDGGQVFFPKNRPSIVGSPSGYVALLAKPTDEVKPEDFVAFLCPGNVGIHIDANVWHQPVYPLADEAEFDDKQGAVHACVSVDFMSEFGCLLSFPLELK